MITKIKWKRNFPEYKRFSLRFPGFLQVKQNSLRISGFPEHWTRCLSPTWMFTEERTYWAIRFWWTTAAVAESATTAATAAAGAAENCLLLLLLFLSFIPLSTLSFRDIFGRWWASGWIYLTFWSWMYCSRACWWIYFIYWWMYCRTGGWIYFFTIFKISLLSITTLRFIIILFFSLSSLANIFCLRIVRYSWM